MAKSMWTPDIPTHLYAFEHSIPDLIPLCCYNNPQCSSNAAH